MKSLDQITGADRSALVQRWESIYEREPPPMVHTAFMRRILAWHIQMQNAGLDPLADRQVVSVKPATTLRPGTRLLREWQGSTHEVRVLDSGFDYAGKNYTSLSAVARAITGTPWSGPVFFGVKRS